MPKKFPPRAYHREVVEYLASLPIGEHKIYVQDPMTSPIKAEGGMIVNCANGKRLCVVPGRS